MTPRDGLSPVHSSPARPGAAAPRCRPVLRRGLTGRRGSAYVMVLGIATLVAVIGFGALLVARVNTRVTVGNNDAIEADALASSAVEQGLALINADPTWRDRYRSGQENGPYALGRGTVSWRAADEYDADLANHGNDIVRLYGTGSVGRARRVYSVQLQPAGPGLPVLGKAAHATTAFNVRVSTATITATGGPLSTDGTFTANGTVDADVEAGNSSGGGFKRTVTNNIPPRQMPSATVFDLYLARSTEIPWQKIAAAGGISGVLSAASNPYGKTNAEGIYHVRVPYMTVLKVDNARLQATLLVTADAGAKVKAGPALLWEPPASDMPSLIARGPDVGVSLDSGVAGLSEALAGQNFNPPGTPYNGAADGDVLDSYPAQVSGLFHVIGTGTTLELGANLRATGVLLTDGVIVAGDLQVPVVMNISLVADRRLISAPPAGYTTGEQMAPVAGTWERRQSP